MINAFGVVKSHPYLQPDGSGWPDNDRRFMAFSAALAALTTAVKPDVLHLNDWHTCAALGHLDQLPPTMLTIHTLGYQGRTNPGWLMTLPATREAFEQWGDCNPLLGGIRLADLVVAVSPHYADEITTPERRFRARRSAPRPRRSSGRHPQRHRRRRVGSADRPAPAESTYSSVGHRREGCRSAAKLLARYGLVDGGGPLLTMVTRLADQKGVDLLLPVTPFLARLGATLIVLGDGDQRLADGLHAAAAAHPQQVAFVRGYDDALAHQLFGGADVFVMPSRFEPCGLAQMQSMRYGTLPLVTDVGGLHDTVVDVDDAPTRGTGIVIPDADRRSP